MVSALSGIDDPEAERTLRRDALSRLRAELADATRLREVVAAAAPDLELAAVTLERARSIVQRADEGRQRLRLELRELDTSIGIQAGEAVDEELADIDVRLEAALTALAGLEFEGRCPEETPRPPWRPPARRPGTAMSSP